MKEEEEVCSRRLRNVEITLAGLTPPHVSLPKTTAIQYALRTGEGEEDDMPVNPPGRVSGYMPSLRGSSPPKNVQYDPSKASRKLLKEAPVEIVVNFRVEM